MDDGEVPKPAQTPGEGLENRRRIFEFIKRTPGAHLRGVQRGIGLPYGTAEYHLHALEDAGLVRTVMDGNLKRFFAADFAFEDRATLSILRKRPIRRVVVTLLEKKEMTHRDLAEAAGVKPPTLTYHLNRLEGANLIAVRRVGRFAYIRLVDPKLAMRLLIAHGQSFADAAVDRFLETFGGTAAARVPEPDPVKVQPDGVDTNDLQSAQGPAFSLLAPLPRPDGDE